MSLFDQYIKTSPPEKRELKIPRFGDIITEQDKLHKLASSINVLILSVKEPSSGDVDDNVKWTANRIKAYCEDHGIPKYTVYMGSAYISRNGDVLKIHNADDEEGFVIDPQKTIAMVRGGSRIVTSSTMRDLIGQLERHDIFCMNSLKTIESCGDKYRTYLELMDAGLPCPRSAIIHSVDMVAPAIQKVGGQFPIVVKLLSGSKGVGVFVVDSHKSLISTLQVMWKLDPTIELLIQEFIESDFDIRVHVLGDEVIASMRRYVIKDDFRSNFSLGSEIETVDLDEEQKNLCIRASKCVGGMWVGVDMIISKVDKKPYFLEINSSPGTFGIEKATKKDLVSVIMNYAIDPKKWVKTPQICGYHEMLEIDGIGELVGKFDTGNGATCVLHAEDIHVNDEKKRVSWKSGGVIFKDKPILRKIKLIKGAIGGKEVSRITVSLNIKFNGTIYKNIEFALDDRAGKTTPVLLSRKFMKEVNIIINPSNEFLLTVRPHEKIDLSAPDDTDFSPEENGNGRTK